MIPLRTLVSLAPSERKLVLRTLPLVAAIRVALWVAPLRRVGRLMRACERLPFSRSRRFAGFPPGVGRARSQPSCPYGILPDAGLGVAILVGSQLDIFRRFISA